MPIRLTNSLLPRGFTFAATHCGLKKTKLDLAILVSETPASAAAVFTTNRVKAAPVIASQLNLRKSKRRMRGVIVNSGNANCCTGSEGLGAAAATTLKVARELGRLDPSQILVSSAGAFELFARAIMTTDTHPKWASAKCRVSGKQVRIAGCTKGAGMIHPNMATMLAFIATDAAISPAMLARALRSTVATTFNAITVDGDTSTNDTVTLLANGASGALAITRENDDWKKFRAALESVCKSLALQIVADGEGAQRVIEVEVRGAPSDRAAKQIALTIANSPLVKTALAGADPNWGRILAAAGRAGVAFDFERADIILAGVRVCRRGRENPFDERIAHKKMLAKYVPIVVDLRSGRGHARVWTCDFTTEYVHINASYRT